MVKIVRKRIISFVISRNTEGSFELGMVLEDDALLCGSEKDLVVPMPFEAYEVFAEDTNGDLEHICTELL